MSDPADRLLAALRDRGLQPRRSGDGWNCRCPAHDDRNPSLSIGKGDDGRALLHCHAGCRHDSICAALGIAESELFPSGSIGTVKPPDNSKQSPRYFETAKAAAEAYRRRLGKDGAPLGHWAAIWTYRSATGEPIGLTIRWNYPDGSKRDIRPVFLIDGRWQQKFPACRPILGINLLASKPQERVFVVEGEKCAEVMGQLGYLATTSPGGSRAAKSADWTPLAAREVIILPDHDEPGERFADDVVRLAQRAGAASIRIVRLVDVWREIPAHGDIADFLAHQGGDLSSTRAAVEELIAKTKPSDPSSRIPSEPSARTRAVMVSLEAVKVEAVSWLWPGRIALGKLTLIAGDPGLGKSFLTLDIAARVSTGAGWPDRPSECSTPGGVVLLNAEDGIADTVKPRLYAANANMEQIKALQAVESGDNSGDSADRSFDLSRDLPVLESAIQDFEGCRLVIIDPLTAYLGGVDSHKNADVRGLLAPLSSIAERHGVAIVAVTHLNKSGGGPAIYRTMGSLAFTAAARAAWAVSKDPSDPHRRLLLPIKNNVAPDHGGLAYRLSPRPGHNCPALEWESDPVSLTADEALSPRQQATDQRPERDGAVEWLRNFLAHSPKPAVEIEMEAERAGFTKRTLERAKSEAGIRSRKADFGKGWVWELEAQPQNRQSRLEDRHTADGGDLRSRSGKSSENAAKTATATKLAYLDD